jgi:hypothetical protein
MKTHPDQFWRRLSHAARPAPGESAPTPAASPWLARRVVEQWSTARRQRPESGAWERVSLQGLACAVAVMLGAVLFNALAPRTQQPWEVLASESVIASVLPQ